MGLQEICEHFAYLMAERALSYANLIDLLGGELVLWRWRRARSRTCRA